MLGVDTPVKTNTQALSSLALGDKYGPMPFVKQSRLIQIYSESWFSCKGGRLFKVRQFPLRSGHSHFNV